MPPPQVPYRGGQGFPAESGRGTRPVFCRFGPAASSNVVDSTGGSAGGGAAGRAGHGADPLVRDRLAATGRATAWGDLPFAEISCGRAIASTSGNAASFDLMRSSPNLCGFTASRDAGPDLPARLWAFWRSGSHRGRAARQLGAPCGGVSSQLPSTVRRPSIGWRRSCKGRAAARGYGPFRATGPDGPIWERRATVSPPARGGKPAPFAIPVLCERSSFRVRRATTPSPRAWSGQVPSGARTPFRLADPAPCRGSTAPRPRETAPRAPAGQPRVRCRDFGAGGGAPEIILVGVPAPGAPDAWGSFAAVEKRARRGLPLAGGVQDREERPPACR